jgi:hypothetical protein
MKAKAIVDPPYGIGISSNPVRQQQKSPAQAETKPKVLKAAEL